MVKEIDKAVEEFQRKLENILKELIEKNGLEIYGHLEIEVANMDYLALLKGNKIYISIKARKYPKFILKYIIAHELAHLTVKKHSKKFWEIVGMIYPKYKEAKRELLRRNV